MRHGVDAELAVGDALELPICRVVLDPLLVSPEPIALVQDRHVPVGEARAAIELIARQRAQAIEMRLDVAPERLGQIDPEQVPERGIRPEEVEPGGVRRDEARERPASIAAPDRHGDSLADALAAASPPARGAAREDSDQKGPRDGA